MAATLPPPRFSVDEAKTQFREFPLPPINGARFQIVAAQPAPRRIRLFLSAGAFFCSIGGPSVSADSAGVIAVDGFHLRINVWTTFEIGRGQEVWFYQFAAPAGPETISVIIEHIWDGEQP